MTLRLLNPPFREQGRREVVMGEAVTAIDGEATLESLDSLLFLGGT
jgi:hypothetical protein